MATQEEVRSSWQIFWHGSSSEGIIKTSLAAFELISRWAIIGATIAFYAVLAGAMIWGFATQSIPLGSIILPRASVDMMSADITVLVVGIAMPFLVLHLVTGLTHWFLDKRIEIRTRIEREITISALLPIFMFTAYTITTYAISMLIGQH